MNDKAIKWEVNGQRGRKHCHCHSKGTKFRVTKVKEYPSDKIQEIHDRNDWDYLLGLKESNNSHLTDNTYDELFNWIGKDLDWSFDKKFIPG